MTLTLDQTWVECIKMWEWIVANTAGITDLKQAYIQEFKPTGHQDLGSANCYFCTYSLRWSDGICNSCPARMVDEDFSCINVEYNYNYEPEKFLAKIEELHAIYLMHKEDVAP